MFFPNKLTKTQLYVVLTIFTFVAMGLTGVSLGNKAQKNSSASFSKNVSSSVLIQSSNTQSLSSLSVISLIVVNSSSQQLSSIVETPKEAPKLDIPEGKIILPNTGSLDIPSNPEPQYIAPEPRSPEPVYTAPAPVYVPPAPELVYTPPTPAYVPPPAPEPVFIPPAPTENLYTSDLCSSSMQYEMLRLVNEHRAANGAGPLSLDYELNGVACAHARWMNQTGIFSHTGREGTNPFQRCRNAGTVCWAENVAYHSEYNAQNLFDLFKNSPGHNKNMINPDYVSLGLGFDGIYVAQNFR